MFSSCCPSLKYHFTALLLTLTIEASQFWEWLLGLLHLLHLLIWCKASLLKGLLPVLPYFHSAVLPMWFPHFYRQCPCLLSQVSQNTGGAKCRACTASIVSLRLATERHSSAATCLQEKTTTTCKQAWLETWLQFLFNSACLTAFCIADTNAEVQHEIYISHHYDANSFRKVEKTRPPESSKGLVTVPTFLEAFQRWWSFPRVRILASKRPLAGPQHLSKQDAPPEPSGLQH